MSGGTSQTERGLRALTQARFAVDGQSLDQQVALCARLASRLRLVDLNGHAVGDWHGLFEHDVSLVLAGIASFDRFARQLHVFRVCDEGSLAEAADEVFQLAELMDTWQARLERGDGHDAQPLRELLAQLVHGQLAARLDWVGTLFAPAPSIDAGLQRRRSALRQPLWRAQRPYRPAQPAPRQALRAVAAAFLDALRQLQLTARASLPASLHSGRHEPAAGLLLAFLQLYGQVQQEVNRFGDRHVDFYHRDVLGLRGRPAAADHALVACQVEPRHLGPVVVPAGTRFEAGKDARGEPVLFEATHTLDAGPVRVAALATLRQQREQAIAPESELGFVSGVRAQRLGPALPAGVTTPAFGGGLGSEDAALGIALASPLLHLAEGERCIDLELHLAWGDAPAGQLLAAALAAGSAGPASDPDPDAFRQAVGQLFACWLLTDTRSLDDADRDTLRALARNPGLAADECGALLDLLRQPALTPADRELLGTLARRDSLPAAQRHQLQAACDAPALAPDGREALRSLLDNGAFSASERARLLALAAQGALGRGDRDWLRSLAGRHGLAEAARRWLHATGQPHAIGAAERQRLLEIAVATDAVSSVLQDLCGGRLLTAEEARRLAGLADVPTLGPADRVRLRGLLAQGALGVDDRAWLRQRVAHLPIAAADGAWLSALADEVEAAEADARAHALAFFKYMGDLFDVALTQPEGWWPVQRVHLVPPQLAAQSGSVADRPGRGSLHLRLVLRPEDPPVVGCDPAVHGAGWPTRLPLLRLQVSPRARVYPVSLLGPAQLVQADLQVDVRGVRRLLLQNNLGPLDASKSFAPFGPLPTTASVLVLGSPEASAKNLSSLALTLRWSGLPDAPGGFASHYAAYGPDLAQGAHTVALSLLSDGQWRPCAGVSARQPLFGAPGDDGRLPATHRVEVDRVSVQTHARAAPAPLDSVTGARHGLLRLQLNQPRGAFGHAAYGPLLSDAVRAQARRRRAGAALPNPPYTPELESIALDYAARSVLQLAEAGAAAGHAGADPERLLHIHPFGIAELHPDEGHRRFGLLPALGPDGSLYIGLDGGDAAQAAAPVGPLTLLFHLRSAGAAELPPRATRPPLQWAHLVRDRWQPLAPHRVLSDTTHGLLGSGIVTLDLPEGLSRDNSVLGGGLYWLRVACTGLLDTAAPLHGVHAQALTLQRVMPAGAAATAQAPAPEPVPAGRIVQPERQVPGLAGVLQVEPSRGARAADDASALHTRAGERLRHKNRASLAWDYERLVLAQFDEVFKAQCFMQPEAGLAAGEVLVVVVPRVDTTAPGYAAAAPRLDTLTLQRIAQTLRDAASRFVSLSVRNAAYERVQARCRLSLAPRAQRGAVWREVNRVITEHLSPWHPDGRGPQLRWQLRCDEVESRVRAVPGVRDVAGLSLLHVVHHDDGHHTLGDTARAQAAVLHHRHPWSLALPLDRHLVDVDDEVDIHQQPADLTRLEIGRTFVIGRTPLAEGVS